MAREPTVSERASNAAAGGLPAQEPTVRDMRAAAAEAAPRVQDMASPTGNLVSGVRAFRGDALKRRQDDLNDWCITIDLNDYEAAKSDPRYWAALQHRLTPLDHVEVRTSLGELVADWIVTVGAGGFGLRFVEVSKTILSEEAMEGVQATGAWHVKFLGPRRFAVIDPRGHVAREGLLSREAAEFELRVRTQSSTRPGHPIMG
jgi:hypothetical protein